MILTQILTNIARRSSQQIRQDADFVKVWMENHEEILEILEPFVDLEALEVLVGVFAHCKQMSFDHLHSCVEGNVSDEDLPKVIGLAFTHGIVKYCDGVITLIE